VLRRQGIEVEWISFETPFFSAFKAKQAAHKTGIKLHVRNITPVYMEMLKNPPCGYGRHMNPCMDCHALMFRLAGEIMREKGFNFLFSGEVLNQRPMSQTRSSLRYVEKRSGLDGYIIRPLSARNLPETIPEKKGWVERDYLLDIEGRSRKQQILLAKEFGVHDYPSPAGGCLLTDKGYSNRLKDLLQHDPDPEERALHLLKFGRHLRLDEKTKLIIGRKKTDNDQIIKYYEPDRDTLIKVKDVPGPTTLIPDGTDSEKTEKAASICAGYSKAPTHQLAEVMVISPQGIDKVDVYGIPPSEAAKFIISS
jgi:tRNA U34 2-thiouridine synthase MnmA/TrmU